MSNRSMPYSIEAEESLLGNIMLYPEAMRQCIDAGVAADDFYLEKHRSIYNVMSSMYENKERVDTVSLSSKLKDFGVYDKIGGLEYLMQLADATISANNTGDYISIIRNKSLARKVIKVGEEISNDAYDASVSVDEMLENVERKVTEVTRSKTSSDFRKGEEVFDSALKHIEAIQEAGTDTVSRSGQEDSRIPEGRPDHRRGPSFHGKECSGIQYRRQFGFGDSRSDRHLLAGNAG